MYGFGVADLMEGADAPVRCGKEKRSLQSGEETAWHSPSARPRYCYSRPAISYSRAWCKMLAVHSCNPIWFGENAFLMLNSRPSHDGEFGETG